MRTKTLFYPNSKKPELEAEVTRNGDIVSCLVLIPAFNVWVDGMEYLRNRPKKIEEIREDAANLNWKDNGDEKYDEFRDQLAEIIGVKPA